MAKVNARAPDGAVPVPNDLQKDVTRRFLLTSERFFGLKASSAPLSQKTSLSAYLPLRTSNVGEWIDPVRFRRSFLGGAQ